MSGWYKVVSSSCSVPTTILFAFLIEGLRAACPSYHTIGITTSVMLMLLFIRFTCPPTFSQSSCCLSFLHRVLPRFTPVADDNVFLKTKITTSTSFHVCITACFCSVVFFSVCRSSKKCSWRVDRDRVVWSLTAPLCSCLTIYLYEQVNQAVSLVSPMSSPSGWQLRWWNEGQIVTCLLYHLLRRGSYNHMCVICR
jgi:hypothetical protein